MYREYYNFTGKPFQLTPDHRFFFESNGHKRALSYLLYGIKAMEGFIVITGDVGTGKTTLVNALSDELENRHIVTAKVVTTQIQEDDLLRVVAAEYGLPYENISKAVLLKNLETFLRQLAHEGKRALLLVDEAQNLPPRSIEELRMLSNFQLDGRALLQSFLLGQREFRATMRLPQFEQLRQRVIAAYHLKPMTQEETKGYIHHRLTMVGWAGNPSFAPEVFEGVYEYTQGIPRKINVFCDRLLLCASLEETNEIDAKILEMVRGDLVEESWGTDEPVPVAGQMPTEATGVSGTHLQDGNAINQQDQLLTAISALIDNKLAAINKGDVEKRTAQVVSIDNNETEKEKENTGAVENNEKEDTDKNIVHGFYPSSENEKSS